MDILDLMKEGKVKRFFQIRNKLAFEGAVYHITQHAPGKEPLFVEQSDYLYMLYLLKENVKKFDYAIFSFVLMSNHLHLLMRLNKANLSLAMKNLFETYAKYFNRKYERKGPVFCKPYRGALCLDDSYLLTASIYIHLNPVKAGLVKDPSDYRWSSCSLYTRHATNPKTFVDYQFILTLLDTHGKKGKLAYRSLIMNATKVEMGNVLEDPKSLEGFHDRIAKYIKDLFSKVQIEKFAERSVFEGEILNRKIGELVGKRRLRKPQEIQARKFLIEQLKSRGYKITEIAKKLNISRVSVYNSLNFTFPATLKM